MRDGPIAGDALLPTAERELLSTARLLGSTKEIAPAQPPGPPAWVIARRGDMHGAGRQEGDRRGVVPQPRGEPPSG